MSSFIKYNLSEITENFDNIRVPLSSKERENIAKIYPYYGAQSIIDFVDDFLFDGEYILIAEDGENLKSQNNNVCNLVNGKFWVNNHAHIIKAKDGHSTKYLYYYLNLINFKPFITGSAQPKLTKDNLNTIPLTIHDKETQKSIAKVLSDLDAKIELNNKINRELEAMAKTLYDYWFVQFDFPNEQGKPYKASGGKMVFNKELKREIPEGWEVKRFGDYAKVKSGFAFKSTWWQDTGVPVLKIKDILEDYTLNQDDFSFVDENKIEIAKNYESKAADVVIAMTGATIGKFAIIPYTDKPILINQRVGLYDLGNKPFEKVPFLVNSMKQDFFRLKVYQMAGGAAQPNISGEQLDNFPLIFPNNALIEKYNKKMISSYKRIANNIKENQQLTALRDWLLPMLMNGQITVGEAEEKLSMAAEPQAEYKKG